MSVLRVHGHVRPLHKQLVQAGGHCQAAAAPLEHPVLAVHVCGGLHNHLHRRPLPQRAVLLGVGGWVGQEGSSCWGRCGVRGCWQQELPPRTSVSEPGGAPTARSSSAGASARARKNGFVPKLRATASRRAPSSRSAFSLSGERVGEAASSSSTAIDSQRAVSRRTPGACCPPARPSSSSRSRFLAAEACCCSERWRGDWEPGEAAAAASSRSPGKTATGWLVSAAARAARCVSCCSCCWAAPAGCAPAGARCIAAQRRQLGPRMSRRDPRGRRAEAWLAAAAGPGGCLQGDK